MKERPHSRLYAILFPLVYIAARLFYRRWRVNGISNFPKKGQPVIIVSNHQNALIDPLLCCLTAPRQLHFLTRADVFRNSLLRPFVLALNMLPVYRMRDIEAGKNERNMLTFKTVIARMKRGAAVGIFPEGNHGNRKMIRPLKKGLAQLLDIMGTADDGLRDTLLIPVGVDYSDYDRARASVVVTYGRPFSVSDHLYGSGERLERYRAVMNKVREQMETVMLDLGPEEHYSLLRAAEAVLVARLGHDRWNEVHEQCHALRDHCRATNDCEKIASEARDLYTDLAAEKLAFTDLAEVDLLPAPSFVNTFLLALFALPGFVIHVPAWQLALAATRKVVIDPHFNSTFRLLFGLLLIGLNWAVLIAAAFSFFPIKTALFGLLGVAVSSILALKLSDRFIDLGKRRTVKRFFKQRPNRELQWQQLVKTLEARFSLKA